MPHFNAAHPRPADALLTVARIAWWLGAALVAFGGAAAALFTLPPVVGVLVVGGAGGVSVLRWVSLRGATTHGVRRALGHRTVVTTWAAAGSLIVGLGVLTVTGMSGLLLLGLLVVTSPPAVARYCVLFPELLPLYILLRRAPTLGPVVSRRGASTLPLTSLSVEQLCRAWRHSSSTIGRARTVAERTAATTIRAGYLDELERRDPAGFSAWIAKSPPPSGDPSRYVRRASRGRAPWLGRLRGQVTGHGGA